MSKQIFHVDGRWTSRAPKLTGPMDTAFWLSPVVFDGARAFGGLAPDLDRHCRRVVESARRMLMTPTIEAEEIEQLCRRAIRKLPRKAELYVRPMFYATGGFIVPDPTTTQFCLAVYDSPLPAPRGFSAMLSSRRRPAADQAPTDAKASCLYPNSARALKEADDKGFDNAIIRDFRGNIAEFASSNLFYAKDGAVYTPKPNGTFLAGVTRDRVIELLRADGVEVVEKTVTMEDVLKADEVFSSGNYAKLLPASRIEDRHFQPGPFYRRARKLYWRFARERGSVL
ncbi:MAG: branched-chain amino acid aminotransferase [Alphaproteobacteria bacterium]|nr:branched-chain amino acid aminotransferase [Alphaproteobacteria bacterium]